ncbi:MAG TPA: hypothetical protein VKJ07_14955 [Mycobacteriales bacterium]|nr:hypothetical protein [Mycobacteriales bacterium]
MRAFVCAGAGFLLAVVWFDLMFDVQVLRLAKGDAPDAAVTSIARYYRRVTSDARPMNRLVALVMVAVLAGIVVELVRDSVPAWVGWTSLVLALAPITLAARRTVRNAVRLGAEALDTPTRAEHEQLARSVARDHVFCFVSVACLVVVQLAGG